MKQSSLFGYIALVFFFYFSMNKDHKGEQNKERCYGSCTHHSHSNARADSFVKDIRMLFVLQVNLAQVTVKPILGSPAGPWSYD